MSFDFDRAQPFTLVGTPLLRDGRSAELVAVGEQMWVHAKVYAEGGERGLHSHPTEDHTFFVVSGRAIFRDRDGQTTEVGPFGGIMIPRGVEYAFDAVGIDNLVILRIGAGWSSAMIDGKITAKHSLGADGAPAKRPDKGTPAPGQFFGMPPS